MITIILEIIIVLSVAFCGLFLFFKVLRILNKLEDLIDRL